MERGSNQTILQLKFHGLDQWAKVIEIYPDKLTACWHKNCPSQDKSSPSFLFFAVSGSIAPFFYFMWTIGEAQINQQSSYLDVYCKSYLVTYHCVTFQADSYYLGKIDNRWSCYWWSKNLLREDGHQYDEAEAGHEVHRHHEVRVVLKLVSQTYFKNKISYVFRMLSRLSLWT